MSQFTQVVIFPYEQSIGYFGAEAGDFNLFARPIPKCDTTLK